MKTMKTRYFTANNSPVPKPLRHLSDAELGRETYLLDRPDDGNRLASTAGDEKRFRLADFEHLRSRARGEDAALAAGL